MCGNPFKSPPKATPVAPPAQQVAISPENTDKQAANKERRRAGYGSTVLSDDRTILGSLGQGAVGGGASGSKRSLGG